ncbi:hypothetical protein [Saccharothrix sp.]|uniref:hypothetical protein n=1 Tax=Saccharothrix sp. TaxID=1873460 RepID=UPI00281137A2|nr:hypothetical protein [Saccharothrix sp.]
MGEQQSPINVRRAVKVSVDFAVGWHEGRFEVEHESHGVRFRPLGSHWVKLDGERFELANVHFHRLSEHWVSGRRGVADHARPAGVAARGRLLPLRGSLTTPDFGENVSWVVMRDPVAPRDPLRGFVLAHGDQARDPQPLHRRFVPASG